MSRYPALPISLYLGGRVILVVGDGDSADERQRRLEAAGATVTRVAQADYRPALCTGAYLVIATGDDREHSRRVAADARAAGCLRYAQDQPAISDFAMPALIRRGPVSVAVSSDAVAPALSRRLREQLQQLFDGAAEQIDTLIATMKQRRAELAPPARAAALYEIASRLHIRGAIEVDTE